MTKDTLFLILHILQNLFLVLLSSHISTSPGQLSFFTSPPATFICPAIIAIISFSSPELSAHLPTCTSFPCQPLASYTGTRSFVPLSDHCSFVMYSAVFLYSCVLVLPVPICHLTACELFLVIKPLISSRHLDCLQMGPVLRFLNCDNIHLLTHTSESIYPCESKLFDVKS